MNKVTSAEILGPLAAAFLLQVCTIASIFIAATRAARVAP